MEDELPLLRRRVLSVSHVMRLVFFFHRRLESMIFDVGRFFGRGVFIFHQFRLQFILSVILQDSLEAQIAGTVPFLELMLDLWLLLRLRLLV